MHKEYIGPPEIVFTLTVAFMLRTQRTISALQEGNNYLCLPLKCTNMPKSISIISYVVVVLSILSFSTCQSHILLK